MTLLYRTIRWFLDFASRVKITWKPLFIQYEPDQHKFKDTFSESDYSDFVDMVISEEIKPGDIILVSSNGYLTTTLIPGYLSHAGIYVGKTNKGEHRIVHAVKYGVIEESIWSIARCDLFVILRPKGIGKRQSNKVVKKAIEFRDEKIPYDYILQFTNTHRMCCTELVYNCYKEFKDEFNIHLTDRYFIKKFGTVPSVTADDFLKFDMELIFANKLCKEKVTKMMNDYTE